MSPLTLKFSKLKGSDDFNVSYESIKKTELHNFERQKFEERLENKKRLLSFFNVAIKEYFARVKLEREISALCQQQNTVCHKLSHFRKELQAKTDAKLNKDSKREVRRSILSLYEKYLGLGIEVVTDKIPIADEEDAISFVFHNIYETNPERTYSFVLVTNGLTYKVMNCNAPVNGISELLTKLDATNDLHSFIVHMRRKFCEFI